MAPEVARNEPVDVRADVYAVGCVAYYLISGRLVFEGTTGLQMILMHASDTPVPPSRHAELPVPAALDDLVIACLAKAPADRPQSALEVLYRLDAIPVEPWSEEQAKRWWGLHQPA
jgi:serine/threonine-protein kinase